MKVTGKIIEEYLPDEFANLESIMEIQHRFHARADKKKLKTWTDYYRACGCPFVVTAVKKPYDKAATLSIWKERVA